MSRPSLIDLTFTYFRRRGYEIQRNVILEGFSGLPRRFELVIRRGDKQRLVWIRAWKRTVGVNMVIGLDKASADVGFGDPVLVAERFSDHAKAYANRRDVTLLTRRQILNRLR